MRSALKICFAASEVSPFAKTGGLADVAAALPLELYRRGHDVRLFLPFHSTIDTSGHELFPVDFIRDVAVRTGDKNRRFSAFTTKAPGTDLEIYLIDCPELFDRPSIYTGELDDAYRYDLFSRAVIECCQRMGFGPDVFHCNDWHTALIPLLLRTVYEWDTLVANSKTMLTVHNLGYQGSFPLSVAQELGLGEWTHLLDQDDVRAGRFNFLRTGLIYCDVITTVSPTYAKEIQTDELGMGLAPLLRARNQSLVGILNGVDYDVWSPETDAFIPHRFSAQRPEGKRKNKLHLLEKLGLSGGAHEPLLGVISRLAHQKGFELCFDTLPQILAASDLRMVVLGAGEERYEQFFEQLQQRFPTRVCYHRGHNDELAHVIEAASDMFLIPSRYEPCGLNQLFSMKYGTIPIVRKTGGLADSVLPYNSQNGAGTGFVFERFTSEGLRWAIEHALRVYRDGAAWQRLMRNAMAQDFSWTEQAKRYEQLYARLGRG